MWAIAIFGAAGNTHYFYTILTPNSQELSSQILADLDLARSDCNNLNSEQKTHLVQTLQSAEKALNVENNRGNAVDLLNSVGSDLRICKPTLELPQGGAELAVLMMVAITTALGIKFILNK